MRLHIANEQTCDLFGIPILVDTTRGELIDQTLAQYAEFGLTRADAEYRVDQAINSGAYRKIMERSEPIEIAPRRAKRGNE